MTTRVSFRAPQSMLLRIFKIFIRVTFVHISCFIGICQFVAPQLTSALGPRMYWIIISLLWVIIPQTVFLIVPLFAVERTTSLLHSDWRCCLLCSSESGDKLNFKLHGWRELFHESKTAEAWNLTLLVEMKNPWVFKTPLTEVFSAMNTVITVMLDVTPSSLTDI